jgi:hypothetical protein
MCHLAIYSPIQQEKEAYGTTVIFSYDALLKIFF